MTAQGPPIPRRDQMLWMADYPLQGAQRSPDRAAITGDTGTTKQLPRMAAGNKLQRGEVRKMIYHAHDSSLSAQ